ncbi:MAG: hypothetical protein LBE22_07255 [Azoarcus sp.]|jgi:hypothetical protein|nr:hypothetical protein [Azoarcus sp.]
MRSLSIKTIIFLIILTSIYLVFELSFNARLLDVVGGNAGREEIEHIEFYGRILSSIAAALFLLQYLLSRGVGFSKILWACILCSFCVYYGLRSFMDNLVDNWVDDILYTSTPMFRRHAVNLVLVQNALVNDRVSLAGVDEVPGLYRLPEGKSFLALFPILAVSMDELDRKMEQTRLQLLREAIEVKVGGVQGYYGAYTKAIETALTAWKKYRGDGLDKEIKSKHNEVWNEYKSRLKRRQLTPDTVARNARLSNSVRDEMRKRLKYLPMDWQPDDEVAVYVAVATEVRQKTADAVVKSYRIPYGLSQTDFINSAPVQKELRERLHLPPKTLVPIKISKQNFIKLYETMCVSQAKKQAKKYTAPVESFADGGDNAKMGLDAARVALVPPVALFFSLFGAIGHLGKLLYLFGKVCTYRRQRRGIWLLPLGVIAVIWFVFSHMENQITRSRLYTAMREHALKNNEGYIQTRLLLNMVHVVAVGQGFAYQFNESIRVHVLRDMTFGYKEKQAEAVIQR